MPERVIEFFYRGQIERWSMRLRQHVWFDGYSEDSEDGQPLYPWITAAEAQANARKRGAKGALFHRGVLTPDQQSNSAKDKKED